VLFTRCVEGLMILMNWRTAGYLSERGKARTLNGSSIHFD